MTDRIAVARLPHETSDRAIYRGKRVGDISLTDAPAPRAAHVITVGEGERRLTAEGRRALVNFASRMRALSRS